MPATFTMHINIAAVKLRLGREEEAIKAAQEALKVCPGHPKAHKAHYRIGQAYTQLGKYQLARSNLSKAEVAASGALPLLPVVACAQLAARPAP